VGCPRATRPKSHRRISRSALQIPYELSKTPCRHFRELATARVARPLFCARRTAVDRVARHWYREDFPVDREFSRQNGICRRAAIRALFRSGVRNKCPGARGPNLGKFRLVSVRSQAAVHASIRRRNGDKPPCRRGVRIAEHGSNWKMVAGLRFEPVSIVLHRRKLRGNLIRISRTGVRNKWPRARPPKISRNSRICLQLPRDQHATMSGFSR